MRLRSSNKISYSSYFLICYVIFFTSLLFIKFQYVFYKEIFYCEYVGTRHIHWRVWNMIIKSKNEGRLDLKIWMLWTWILLWSKGDTTWWIQTPFRFVLFKYYIFSNDSFMTTLKGKFESFMILVLYSSKEVNSYGWHEMVGWRWFIN